MIERIHNTCTKGHKKSLEKLYNIEITYLWVIVFFHVNQGFYVHIFVSIVFLKKYIVIP